MMNKVLRASASRPMRPPKDFLRLEYHWLKRNVDPRSSDVGAAVIWKWDPNYKWASDAPGAWVCPRTGMIYSPVEMRGSGWWWFGAVLIPKNVTQGMRHAQKMAKRLLKAERAAKEARDA